MIFYGFFWLFQNVYYFSSNFPWVQACSGTHAILFLFSTLHLSSRGFCLINCTKKVSSQRRPTTWVERQINLDVVWYKCRYSSYAHYARYDFSMWGQNAWQVWLRSSFFHLLTAFDPVVGGFKFLGSCVCQFLKLRPDSRCSGVLRIIVKPQILVASWKFNFLDFCGDFGPP